ncbi:MAG: DNA alkylation repair protein [Methanomassiliicoccales archaeon]|nr:DNA alkylation repair protein [Methanomassiliicoccales archaeon]
MNGDSKASSEYEDVLRQLRDLAEPSNIAGMARYGISTVGALGVSMPKLRGMAKRIGSRHGLALELWDSGLHEARILAALIAEPGMTDRAMMESWVRQFDSWDVCDQVCASLFRIAKPAYEVILDWTVHKEEFVRRAGFVMIAALAVHDKKSKDEVFLGFFPLIEKQAGDNRNYVKKAVSWAVRQMGKRDLRLREECIRLAERLREQGSPSARWIASDVIRELDSDKVLARLEAKRARASV